MIKTSFYSIMMKDNKKQAILHHGYSDGTYYYFKGEIGGTWYAIHPLTGLSVANCYTRKEAQQKAHSSYIQEKLKSIYADKKRYSEMNIYFNQLVTEARNEN